MRWIQFGHRKLTVRPLIERSTAFWASFPVMIALLLHGFCLLLDSTEQINWNLQWTQPNVWPLSLLGQAYFAGLMILAGGLLLLDMLHCLRKRWVRLVAWHLALYVLFNITMYASIAMVIGTVKPLVSWATYTALFISFALYLWFGTPLQGRVQR